MAKINELSLELEQGYNTDYEPVDEEMLERIRAYSVTTKEELACNFKEGLYSLMLLYNEEVAEAFDDLKNPTLDTIAEMLHLAGVREVSIG